jgi:hypothetical protein
MDTRQRQELDRFITGNYGEDSVASEGVLSEECEQELINGDMYSQPDRMCDEWASVRDEEGTHMFTVSRSIDLLNLRAILTFGKRQFEAGRKWGRVEMQHQLRTLLDVPANPPTEQ